MSRITVADCRRLVGTHYRIPKELMVSRVRKRKIARPRQMAMVLACEFTDASTTAIGAHFERDHTTVLHAKWRIRDLEEWKPQVREAMDEFRRALSGSVTLPQEAAQ